MAFYDIGAVVVFLRKVIWIVPDFTVDRYRDRLAALHEHILIEGQFVRTPSASSSRRALARSSRLRPH